MQIYEKYIFGGRGFYIFSYFKSRGSPLPHQDSLGLRIGWRKTLYLNSVGDWVNAKKICLLKYAQNKAVVRLLQLFYKFNRPGLIFKMNVFIMWSVKCDFKKLSDTRSLQSLQTLGSWS